MNVPPGVYRETLHDRRIYTFEDAMRYYGAFFRPWIVRPAVNSSGWNWCRTVSAATDGELIGALRAKAIVEHLEDTDSLERFQELLSQVDLGRLDFLANTSPSDYEWSASANGCRFSVHRKVMTDRLGCFSGFTGAYSARVRPEVKIGFGRRRPFFGDGSGLTVASAVADAVRNVRLRKDDDPGF